MIIISRPPNSPDEFMIDDQGSVVGPGCHEPDEESAFENRVKGNHGEKRAGKYFKDDQKSEDDPIRQPLFIVIRIFSGLDR